jgi:hypothetical protein
MLALATSKLIVFILALSRIVAPGTVNVQGRQGRGAAQSMRFLEMDQNHNGVIARNEWSGSPASFQTVLAKRSKRSDIPVEPPRLSHQHGFG